MPFAQSCTADNGSTENQNRKSINKEKEKKDKREGKNKLMNRYPRTRKMPEKKEDVKRDRGSAELKRDAYLAREMHIWRSTALGS